MRDLENQDYLNIIKSDCVRITDIRTEDDVKISLDELDDIILGAENIEANEFCEDNQQYCIACIYHEKLVALTKYGLKLALYEKSWKNISKKYFAKYLEQEISFHEQGAQRIKKFFELGKTKITLQEAERVFFEYKEVLEKNWVLFDDVLPCLKKISTVEKGIASNGQVAQQNNKLEKTGIAACFSMKKYASEMNCAKPDYRFFELLKRYCGDENYIYVGDDLQTDIYPCMNLGIKAIWINRMGEEVPEGVNAIQSLKELEIEDKE